MWAVMKSFSSRLKGKYHSISICADLSFLTDIDHLKMKIMRVGEVHLSKFFLWKTSRSLCLLSVSLALLCGDNTLAYSTHLQSTKLSSVSLLSSLKWRKCLMLATLSLASTLVPTRRDSTGWRSSMDDARQFPLSTTCALAKQRLMSAASRRKAGRPRA